MHRSRPGVAATLLDLLALVEAPERVLATVADDDVTTRDALTVALAPTGDRSTRTAIGRLLADLDVPDALGTTDVAALAELLALAEDLEATIRARSPAPPSSLVVTASGSPALGRLQRELALIPLFQLVEDVVRSATATCWLGAPYWNNAAVERLWPAIAGFARRGGKVELVCQGGEVGDADPRPALRRAAADIVGEGGSCRIWTFEARSAAGVSLLIHGKFAVADETLGYLGSANMTRQGFAEHFELGVRLPEVEAAHLVRLLDSMRDGGVLVADDGAVTLP